MVTMQLVVVSAVSAAVAAAMSMRRIASQTEFFFMVVIFFEPRIIRILRINHATGCDFMFDFRVILSHVVTTLTSVQSVPSVVAF